MRRWITGLGLVGALALTACGGSDDGDSAATTTASSAPAAATTAPGSTAASTPSSAPASPDSSAPATAGPASTAPVFVAEPEFCTYVEELRERSDIVDDAFGGDSTPTLARQAWDELDEVLEGLVARAPDLIKDDIGTTEQAFAELRDAFEEFDYDTQKLFTAAETDPDLAATLAFTDDPEFQAAAQRIDAFVTRACGTT